MLTSSFRPFVRRIGKYPSINAVTSSIIESASVSNNINASTHASPTSRRFITTEQEHHFQGLGVLDAEGMTKFETLHELQLHSSLVFKENELFGTYEEDSKTFQYITYDEYGERINQCRVLLKDLGE